MLAQFGMSIPLVAAPMAGGPTTPAMVSAANQAGALGMLAAGYKTVEAVEAEITKIRAEGIPFGGSFMSVGSMSGPGEETGARGKGKAIYFFDPNKHLIEIRTYAA